MWNRCVVEWLKNLRYNIENYDDFTLSNKEMELRRQSGSYENIWECTSQENEDFHLKYGKVCRVSLTFSDSLENLPTLPIVYENLNLNESDDVIMWKRQLRYTYYGEEENFFEGEDLITEFKETKDDVGSITKPGSFPVFEEETEPVQVRTRSIREKRPQTFTSPGTKKKDDSYCDFKGPFKIKTSDDEEPIIITSNQIFRLLNDQFEILDESRNLKKVYDKVTFEKGVKIINKKELEMTDTNKTIYRFYFDTPKDSKLFIEKEKSRPSTTKEKPPGFSITQLLKLLRKRSSRDLLEMKGIIKNEPIFGNTLNELCDLHNPVPEVITRIVKLIEEPDNITSLGLYRASANLATVQHIRCEINCGRWEVLEKYRKDVDVLAGTLKLFFRELKEPIIPYNAYQELLTVIRGASSETIPSIVARLPDANKATLIFIIKHLLNVCKHKHQNKMDIHNMAICWGPSLIMFPDNCVDLVAQTAEFTTITEHLLEFYSTDQFKEVKEPEVVVVVKNDFVLKVVEKIIELIELNLDTEGIYRKSGSNTKIDKIMKQLEMKNLEVDAKTDIHDLCCVLKKFLSSLKEPLIPNEIFTYYCESCDKLDNQSLKEEIRNRINDIPQKDVLLLLLQHLRNVIEHGRNNRMSMTSMTDIWMTTLASTVMHQYKKKLHKFSKFFEILINLNEQVFPDLLPESEALLRIRESRYDNVSDDDISNKRDSFSDVTTKL